MKKIILAIILINAFSVKLYGATVCMDVGSFYCSPTLSFDSRYNRVCFNHDGYGSGNTFSGCSYSSGGCGENYYFTGSGCVACPTGATNVGNGNVAGDPSYSFNQMSYCQYCKKGYYGSGGMVGSNNCFACPNGGTSSNTPSSNGFITSCYKEYNSTLGDTTGTVKFSSDCYYKY